MAPISALLTSEALDTPAFKISTAALVELGYLEVPTSKHTKSLCQTPLDGSLDMSNMEQRGPMTSLQKAKTTTSRTAQAKIICNANMMWAGELGGAASGTAGDAEQVTRLHRVVSSSFS